MLQALVSTCYDGLEMLPGTMLWTRILLYQTAWKVTTTKYGSIYLTALQIEECPAQQSLGRGPSQTCETECVWLRKAVDLQREVTLCLPQELLEHQLQYLLQLK